MTDFKMYLNTTEVSVLIHKFAMSDHKFRENYWNNMDDISQERCGRIFAKILLTSNTLNLSDIVSAMINYSNMQSQIKYIRTQLKQNQNILTPTNFSKKSPSEFQGYKHKPIINNTTTSHKTDLTLPINNSVSLSVLDRQLSDLIKDKSNNSDMFKDICSSKTYSGGNKSPKASNPRSPVKNSKASNLRSPVKNSKASNLRSPVKNSKASNLRSPVKNSKASNPRSPVKNTNHSKITINILVIGSCARLPAIIGYDKKEIVKRDFNEYTLKMDNAKFDKINLLDASFSNPDVLYKHSDYIDAILIITPDTKGAALMTKYVSFLTYMQDKKFPPVCYLYGDISGEAFNKVLSQTRINISGPLDSNTFGDHISKLLTLC
jgi:hypothetical protein